MVSDINRVEFLGQIIDLFEDFLDWKWEQVSDGIANGIAFEGELFNDLYTEIECLMENWHVIRRLNK